MPGPRFLNELLDENLVISGLIQDLLGLRSMTLHVTKNHPSCLGVMMPALHMTRVAFAEKKTSQFYIKLPLVAGQILSNNSSFTNLEDPAIKKRARNSLAELPFGVRSFDVAIHLGSAC